MANLYIRVAQDGTKYFEFMSDVKAFVTKTFRADSNVNSSVQSNMFSGSWTRGGLAFTYGCGCNIRTGYDDNSSYITYFYSPSGTTLEFGVQYIPKINIAYNANGGLTAPAT